LNASKASQNDVFYQKIAKFGKKTLGRAARIASESEAEGFSQKRLTRFQLRSLTY